MKFETETCTRCGGSGHYSRCQMYGTICFRCSGAGVTYTKRGEAAYKMYIASLKKRADELKPGDRILFTGDSKWQTVEAIGEGVDGTCQIVEGERIPMFGILTGGNSGWSGPQSYMVRVSHTKEEKAPKFAAAMKYQNSLTKAGKPRKRIITPPK